MSHLNEILPYHSSTKTEENYQSNELYLVPFVRENEVSSRNLIAHYPYLGEHIAQIYKRGSGYCSCPCSHLVHWKVDHGYARATWVVYFCSIFSFFYFRFFLWSTFYYRYLHIHHFLFNLSNYHFKLKFLFYVEQRTIATYTYVPQIWVVKPDISQDKADVWCRNGHVLAKAKWFLNLKNCYLKLTFTGRLKDSSLSEKACSANTGSLRLPVLTWVFALLKYRFSEKHYHCYGDALNALCNVYFDTEDLFEVCDPFWIISTLFIYLSLIQLF